MADDQPVVESHDVVDLTGHAVAGVDIARHVVDVEQPGVGRLGSEADLARLQAIR